VSAPEPTPFAYIGPKGFYVAGVRINDGRTTDDEIALTTIAAAVQRERQAAAVKALWDAVDALDAVLGESAKFDPAANWLRGRAEAMQYIASRAERAERGDHA